MKKIFFIILFLVPAFVFSTPVRIADLYGRWELRYRGNFGYSFQFQRNYNSQCILYLKNNALVFKGVYTIEKGNLLRINIYKMKNERKAGRINLNKNFVKTSSSYFLFSFTMERSAGIRTLVLAPQKIVIDGSDSSGYFEPVIRLKKR